MKNILITGGAGFIGSKLSLYLLELGFEITVLDSLLPQVHGENPEQDSPLFQSIDGKVKFIKGDICNKTDVENALKNQDAVIHLAAETGTGQSMYEIAKYTQTNVQGTAVLLDAIINTKSKIKKFVLASSRAVYGEGKYQNSKLGEVFPASRSESNMKSGVFEMMDAANEILQPLATDEKSALHPTSLYGLTKLQQEQLVAQVCSSVGINFIIFRYQNVYGVGQSLTNPYTGILSIFSTQILSGQNINIFEDGKATRDFVYIDDVVSATALAMTNTEIKNEIFNVGTGAATTILEIAEQLMKTFNKKISLNISGDFRLGDIRHNFADVAHLKTTLNFQASILLDEGMKKFASWVIHQNIAENGYEKSLEEMKSKGFLKS